jgi:hypothetical protein
MEGNGGWVEELANSLRTLSLPSVGVAKEGNGSWVDAILDAQSRLPASQRCIPYINVGSEEGGG